jgi:hypothetical protein
MILYFDRIYVISPNEASMDATNPDLDTLLSEGIIKAISPSRLLSEYDRLLTQSVVGDLADPDFLKLASSVRGHSWEIYSEKVPSSLADGLLRKYFVDIPNFYAADYPTHNLREGPYGIVDEERMRELIEQRHRFYEERRYDAEHREREYREFRHVRLPFEVGESLMINHAICASSCQALTPITDSDLHHNFLLYKLTRANGSPFLKNVLKDYGYIKDIKTDLTALTVISETVPILTGAPISDVLEFRDENKEALEAFRIEMGKLSAEIQSNFWDDEFQKEVIDAIDSKVKPSIADLKASTESSKEKLARIFKRGAEISSLPVFASIAVGCPPELAFALSGGVAALGGYLEYVKQKRQDRRNGFAYLFNMQKSIVSNPNARL